MLRSFMASMALLLPLWLWGCGDDNLPDYVQLGDLRILAMKANLPEVNPAEALTVTVTPVVSDLKKGRALTYSAEACADPGVGLGASPSCTGRPDRVVLATNASVPSLDTVKKTFTGTAPALSFLVPATVFLGRSAADQLAGVAYLVVYTLTATDATTGATEALTAFKRVIASTTSAGNRNVNPAVNQVKAGDVTLLAYLGTLQFPGSGGTPVKSTLTVELDSATLQNETVTVTWFITDGSVKRFRTLGSDPNSWDAPVVRPSARSIAFVVVARDERGGEDFEIIEQ